MRLEESGTWRERFDQHNRALKALGVWEGNGIMAVCSSLCPHHGVARWLPPAPLPPGDAPRGQEQTRGAVAAAWPPAVPVLTVLG